MELTREYYLPKGARKITCKRSRAVAYVYANTSGQPCAIAFHGRAQKPDWRFRFRTEAERARRIAEHFDCWARNAERKAQERADRKAAKRGVEVGHILVSSWGNEQTNVDFYKVTKLIGSTMVEIVEIGQMMAQADTSMSEHVVPNPDAVLGAPMRKRCVKGVVSIESYTSARIWDGRPVYQSHYH